MCEPGRVQGRGVKGVRGCTRDGEHMGVRGWTSRPCHIRGKGRRKGRWGEIKGAHRSTRLPSAFHMAGALAKDV